MSASPPDATAQSFGGAQIDRGTPIVAALGLGVDSTAMLIEWIERGRRLDAILFADTGSERPKTYAFKRRFAAWLRRRGHRIETVRYEPRRFKHYPPYRTLDENCLTNATLPSISFGRHSCSLKWKVAPQDAWLARWLPAIEAWKRGDKVIKLIGYDAGTADTRRYNHAQSIADPRYDYRYPLREWGWTRSECEDRIARAGLPIPPKSACFMCAASKPWEIDDLPDQQLRRIILMEARAKPRLRAIDGLWRTQVKGSHGGVSRPGDMTSYIRDHQLLPSHEIDAIIALAPAALTRFQADASQLPVERRPEMADWIGLFEASGRVDFGDLYAAGDGRTHHKQASAAVEPSPGAMPGTSRAIQATFPQER